MNQKHLLVIGAGSVGNRHLRNFSSLGCLLSAMDPRADRLDEAAGEVRMQRKFTDLKEALAVSDLFSGVIVCSPTKFHVDQCIASLDAGLPVFLEKPVSMKASSAEKLARAVESSGVPLLLGYTYRWWPVIQELKNRLNQNVLGQILHVQCIMSAHLADWHPWERYQDFFMSSKDLGGGALLDESHFLDLMLWFFGMPNEVFARIEHLSQLEIETDDNVDSWLVYENGPRIMMHLDLYGRPHQRDIIIRGDQGTLHWSVDPNRIRFSRSAGLEWEDSTYTCERNDMFLNAAKEFMQILDTGKAPSCTIHDGLAVMRIIEAMQQSSKTGRTIKLDS
jgi:predicted dehydrogenase